MLHLFSEPYYEDTHYVRKGVYQTDSKLNADHRFEQSTILSITTNQDYYSAYMFVKFKQGDDQQLPLRNVVMVTKIMPSVVKLDPHQEVVLESTLHVSNDIEVKSVVLEQDLLMIKGDTKDHEILGSGHHYLDIGIAVTVQLPENQSSDALSLILDFNPGNHSGMYCWNIYSSIHPLFHYMRTGTCVVVIPRDETLEPIIELRPRSRDNKFQETNILPLYSMSNDRLVCTVKGMTSPSVQMSHHNSDGSGTKHPVDTFSHPLSMAYFQQYKFGIFNAQYSDAGIYSCSASMDGQDTIHAFATAAMLEKLTLDKDVKSNKEVGDHLI